MCVCVCVFILVVVAGVLVQKQLVILSVSAVDMWTKMTVVSVDTDDVDVAAAITALACLM